MAHIVSSRQKLIRLRREGLGWEVVYCVGVRRGKVRIMVVPRHAREEKYFKGYRQKIKERPE